MTLVDSTTPLVMPTLHAVDGPFFIRLIRLMRILIQPPSPYRVWSFGVEARRKSIFWITMLLFALHGGSEILVYYTGLIPSRFYAILVARDLPQFLHFVIPCALLVLGTATGKSLTEYVGGLFAIKVRRRLTEHIHVRAFLRSTTVYHLIEDYPHLDNPDQRIAQDIDKLADTLRDMVQRLILTPFLILIYTWQCWMVTGVLGPAVIYGYFVIGAGMSRRYIRPLIRAVYDKELAEGNFRHLLMRLCQFAESVALNQGAPEEKIRADHKLFALLSAQRTTVTRALPLQLVNQGFAYIGSILSYVIIAVPIFSGAMDDKDSGDLSAIISKHAFMSMYLIHLFTTIIEQTTQLSNLAGYTVRISEVFEAFDDGISQRQTTLLHSAIADSENEIQYDKVKLHSPGGKLIVTNFTLNIPDGTHTALVGPNGSGKTSLIRALAGVWPCSKGHICVPNGGPADILFLSQSPYTIHGSLRDQVCYPRMSSSVRLSDYDLISLLEQVKVSHIVHQVESFDTPLGHEWDTMLSPGEQQRLMFARVLYWKPRYAVLDESTSAMDSDTETHLYQLLRDLGTTTLISVSHHSNIIQQHDQVVLLDGQGSYTISYPLDGSSGATSASTSTRIYTI